MVGNPGLNDAGEKDRSLDEIYFFVGEHLEGCKYIVEIQEDETLVVKENKGGGINFAPKDDASSGIGGVREKEGCSCLYGNPCMDQYVCNDWANRFEVAKKNGFKG